MRRRPGTFDWGVETIGAIMVVMQVALIILIAPSLSAGLISVEREHGGWLLLQTTPLSTGRIIWGKLLSALLPLMLVLCATMPGYLVMAYIEPGMGLQVRLVLICLALTAVFAMLCSAAVGCLFSRTAPATATAYGVLLAICGLPMLVWMGRDAPFGHDVVESALSFSSIAAAFSVIRMPGFQNYDLIPANWWIPGHRLGGVAPRAGYPHAPPRQTAVNCPPGRDDRRSAFPQTAHTIFTDHSYDPASAGEFFAAARESWWTAT